jgi:mono/diheme cytochrome c family protein
MLAAPRARPRGDTVKQSNRVARNSLACASILASAAGLAACDAYDHDLPPSGVSTQASPPPAISGGTLLVTDEGLAVAADADRDQVWVVDVASGAIRGQLDLEEGDEPGRVVADDRGNFHVALRGGAAIVDFDVTGTELGRRDACPAPRGLLFDAASDVLHLACAGGELMTFPVDEGQATRTVRVAADLRDIALDGDNLVVSLFRSAQVITLGPDGEVLRSHTPPLFVPMSGQGELAPTVAWRMISLPDGGVAVSHQRSLRTTITLTSPDAYAGGGCDPSIVQSTVTVMRDLDGAEVPSAALAAPSLAGMSLPVDMAISRSGGKLAVVAAGSNMVIEMPTSQGDNEAGSSDCSSSFPTNTPGQPVAAAYDAGDQLVIQLREPAALVVGGRTIQLSDVSRKDTGHDFFHRPAQRFDSGSDQAGDGAGNEGMFFTSSLACASCHPEGREDGHTWLFDIGPRRTQNIGGGVLHTGPLHWDGDLGDFDEMLDEVFVRRMSGTKPGKRTTAAFARWIDALPMLPTSPAADVDAVQRGRALFESEAVGCASCHSGQRLTNEKNSDVGTGKAFQVPSLLGVAQRAPLMHDGCAATLEERFTNPACGGGDKHGVTSHLAADEIADLVAYLETL